jgi:hypothetical protein
VDDDDESLPTLNSDIEADVKEFLGLFDLPAFARRGQELEHAVKRLHDRCGAARGQMLEMVRLRLRQWSRAVDGPAAWAGVFSSSIEPLWLLSGAERSEWTASPSSARQQRAVARDLVSAVLRFNRRWLQFVERVNLDPTNRVIEQYNRYYVLEKECVMGSARLAARHFTPVDRITKESLLAEHPVLPVPELDFPGAS